MEALSVGKNVAVASLPEVVLVAKNVVGTAATGAAVGIVAGGAAAAVVSTSVGAFSPNEAMAEKRGQICGCASGATVGGIAGYIFVPMIVASPVIPAVGVISGAIGGGYAGYYSGKYFGKRGYNYVQRRLEEREALMNIFNLPEHKLSPFSFCLVPGKKLMETATFLPGSFLHFYNSHFLNSCM